MTGDFFYVEVILSDIEVQVYKQSEVMSCFRGWVNFFQ